MASRKKKRFSNKVLNEQDIVRRAKEEFITRTANGNAEVEKALREGNSKTDGGRFISGLVDLSKRDSSVFKEVLELIKSGQQAYIDLNKQDSSRYSKDYCQSLFNRNLRKELRTKNGCDNLADFRYSVDVFDVDWLSKVSELKDLNNLNHTQDYINLNNKQVGISSTSNNKASEKLTEGRKVEKMAENENKKAVSDKDLDDLFGGSVVEDSKDETKADLDLTDINDSLNNLKSSLENSVDTATEPKEEVKDEPKPSKDDEKTSTEKAIKEKKIRKELESDIQQKAEEFNKTGISEIQSIVSEQVEVLNYLVENDEKIAFGIKSPGKPKTDELTGSTGKEKLKKRYELRDYKPTKPKYVIIEGPAELIRALSSTGIEGNYPDMKNKILGSGNLHEVAKKFKFEEPEIDLKKSDLLANMNAEDITDDVFEKAMKEEKEKARKYAEIEKKSATLSNREHILLNIKNFSNFLSAFARPDIGIRESKVVKDKFYPKKKGENTKDNGEDVPVVTVRANLDALNKLMIRKRKAELAGVSIAEKGPADSKTGAQKSSIKDLIEKKKTSIENFGPGLRIGLGRLSNQILTTRNYIPLKIFDTFNLGSGDLTTKYEPVSGGDLKGATTDKLDRTNLTYKDTLENGYALPVGAVQTFEPGIENVVDTTTGIPLLFSDDEKVRQDAFTASSGDLLHWYTNKGFQMNEVNLAVKVPRGFTKREIKKNGVTIGETEYMRGSFQTRKLVLDDKKSKGGLLEEVKSTDTVETVSANVKGSYTIDDIANQHIVNAIGKDKLKELLKKAGVNEAKKQGKKDKTSLVDANYASIVDFGLTDIFTNIG